MYVELSFTSNPVNPIFLIGAAHEFWYYIRWLWEWTAVALPMKTCTHSATKMPWQLRNMFNSASSQSTPTCRTLPSKAEPWSSRLSISHQYQQVYTGNNTQCAHLFSSQHLDLIAVCHVVLGLSRTWVWVNSNPGRFMSTAGNAGEVLYKRGQDITVGDKMWAQGSPKAHETTMFVVTSISRVEKEGLYNPFTLGGTIIVNGVAASTHSDWFLDTTFESLGINTHWLPAAYQMVLFPVRMLYRVLGKDLYLSIYHRLDALVNIAEVGTTHGGSILTSVGATSAMIAALLLSKLGAYTHGQKWVQIAECVIQLTAEIDVFVHWLGRCSFRSLAPHWSRGLRDIIPPFFGIKPSPNSQSHWTCTVAKDSSDFLIIWSRVWPQLLYRRVEMDSGIVQLYTL